MTARPSRLLCTAVLAALTGGAQVTTEAEAMLSEVACPPGGAWVLGADSYLLLARAAQARGDIETAERLVEPLRVATTTKSWRAIHDRAAFMVAQSRSSTSRAARSAPSRGTAK